MDLTRVQGVDLVAAYRSGELSPVEATRAALDAIDRSDEQVNAFVLVDAEGALAAAKESEARWQTGSHWVPATAFRPRSKMPCGQRVFPPCEAVL
jgi:Asp-tRNA(Asn)/Glu-tRNA(Gln) amidotransferase A subunit family amidase